MLLVYIMYAFRTPCSGEAKGVAEKGRMPLARLKLRLTTLITVLILYGIATGVKVIGTAVRLIYTIPMPPKGISQETVGVLPYCTLWWAVEDLNL